MSNKQRFQKKTRRVKASPDGFNKYNEQYLDKADNTSNNYGSYSSKSSHDKRPLVLRNRNQERYLGLIRTKNVIFADGFPGCAKTLIALYGAFELLDDRKIEKIYVVRPRVPVAGEEKLGALPGDLAEKTEPHMMAIVEALSVFMSKERIDYLMKARDKPDAQMEYLHMDYLRGRTLNNCVVIIDEAQNITSHSMYSILSRIGDNGKIIITGDTNQRDLRANFGLSGLEDSIKRLKKLSEVGLVTFVFDDIERGALAKAIIGQYSEMYD